MEKRFNPQDLIKINLPGDKHHGKRGIVLQETTERTRLVILPGNVVLLYCTAALLDPGEATQGSFI